MAKNGKTLQKEIRSKTPKSPSYVFAHYCIIQLIEEHHRYFRIGGQNHFNLESCSPAWCLITAQMVDIKYPQKTIYVSHDICTPPTPG